jgi:flavin-dependent dehydrogenase
VNHSFDVVVLGGGPCGLAAATALAMRGRRVGVFERNHFGGPRVGETFGPEIATTLRELGVFDDFLAIDKIPFRGEQSAWGGNELVDRPSIVHPLGEGFHVDRALFDALLAQHAREKGVSLFDEIGVASIESTPSGWRLSWPMGLHADARFVIDASGRGAPAGARGFPERHWVACDRAVGIVTRLSPPPDREFAPELLIETVELGWWYVALQPGPVLLCVLITDADLIGANHRAELPFRWQSAFETTAHVRALCAEAKIIDGPRIVRADTGFLLPNHGRGWRAVGDAAFATDPLSGDGIARGLADALETARSVDETLASNDGAPDGPLPSMDKRVPAYLDRRQQYYRMEQRWPNALFWTRRHAVDWQSAPILLDPRAYLRSSGSDPDVFTIAPIEGFVPPRILRALLERYKTAIPAHEALGYLRSIAPLGDRRLLMALQELVSRGLLVADKPTLSP